MANELIINASLPETRIALMEDGEIQELLIERASGKGIVGNIYKGRVTRVLPGMQAAFVDIGLEKAAFLYVDDVYVHSEIWEKEEDEEPEESGEVHSAGEHSPEAPEGTASESVSAGPEGAASESASSEPEPGEPSIEESGSGEFDEEFDDEDDDEGDPEDGAPALMSADPDSPEGGDGDSNEPPQGTVAPESSASEDGDSPRDESSDAQEGGDASSPRRHRRGRRGGRNRRRGRDRDRPAVSAQGQPQGQQEEYPENFQEQVGDSGMVQSDRADLSHEGGDSDHPAPQSRGSHSR